MQDDWIGSLKGFLRQHRTFRQRREKIPLLLLLLTLTLPSSAEAKKLAIHLGLGMSTPAYTNSAVTNLDVKDRTSYGVGLSYEWIWGPYFSLQPEIDWVTKGYRVTYDSSVATGVMETLSASYLDVPVTFKARYPLSSVTPYFGFQLLLSLLMSSTLELESQGIRTESDATALMSGSDFGTGFLGGIEIFASRRVSFFFELRYHQTFGDFLVSETTGASNRLFRVVFGPRFDAF